MMAAMQGTRAALWRLSAAAADLQDTDAAADFTRIPNGCGRADDRAAGHADATRSATPSTSSCWAADGRWSSSIPIRNWREQRAARAGSRRADTSSDLPKLFKAWGVAFNPAKVIVDRALAQRVQVSTDPRNPVALYPIWLHLGADQFDAKDPVTANLKSSIWRPPARCRTPRARRRNSRRWSPRRTKPR